MLTANPEQIDMHREQNCEVQLVEKDCHFNINFP